MGIAARRNYLTEVGFWECFEHVTCRFLLSSLCTMGRSKIGGGGCHKFVLVFGGDGTKIAPPGDLFDQRPGEMR